jgi:putative addiction module killer protein
VWEIRQSSEFREWLSELRDDRAVARITARIRRLELGNPGDAKPLGPGLWEMRVDYGPGYRIYYVRRGTRVILLLCAGDKRTQRRDIRRAEALAAEKEE